MAGFVVGTFLAGAFFAKSGWDGVMDPYEYDKASAWFSLVMGALFLTISASAAVALL